MKKIKVVFFGTPEFAVLPLGGLIQANDIEVVAVVTQPDKPVGRKQILTPPPVKNVAIAEGITVLQPEKIRSNHEFIELLKGLNADVFAVVAYGKILPKEVLDIPRHGCVNLHGSLLPKYRGASPVEEALLRGDTQTGITFIQMSEELDAGDILLIQREGIDPTDTSETLRQKLSLLGAALFPDLLRDLVEGTLQPIPQNHSKASFCHKITKQDGLMNVHNETALQIINKLRAYTPWPSCYLFVQNKRLKILEAIADINNTQVQAGVVIDGKPDGSPGIGIGTLQGVLWLKSVQLEGKNPTTIEEFIRGNKNFFKENL